MTSRTRRPSAQTRTVLQRLADQPDHWHHGYELSRETGIASGTLYPLLMRLADRGYLESKWDQPLGAGRPLRHLYRLTAAGREYATQAARRNPQRVVSRPVGDGI